MCKAKKVRFILKIHSIIITIFLLFFLTDLVYGNLRYYYLHVGSFQSDKNASQFARDLQKKGLETVIRGEEVTDRGFWYRIYVGPFYSRLEAELKSRDLKGKGIIDYAAIHKKDSLLSSNIEEKTEAIDKGEKPITEQPVSKITPPPEKTAPVGILPSEPPPVEKKPHITEHPIDRVPSAEEKITLEKTPPPLKTKPARQIYPKPPSPFKSLKRGYGRNTRKWGLTLCLNYTYRDIQTMVIKPDPNYILKEDERDDFPTHMHMTTLQLRLGLTDYLEIFGNAGTAFDDPSELGFTYGGGLRLNLFEIRGGKLKGFYSALQGEYLSGDFDEEYISNVNKKWKRETEWEELTAKVELGFTRSRFTAYLGGTYFQYAEDTKRHPLEGTEPPRLDEIEEKDNFGAYGGIAIHFTQSLIANLEGEILSQKRISLSLEYLF